MTDPQSTSYNEQKTTNISTKIGNKTGISVFTALIQHSARSPTHSNQKINRNKKHLNWKGGWVGVWRD